jgi:hypothetical protein
MNPKMINSAIRSAVLAGCTFVVTWLFLKGYITADQIPPCAALLVSVLAGGGMAAWGILEKREPKLAAEIVELANRAGIDPEDLLGLEPAQIANAVQAKLAALPPPAPSAAPVSLPPHSFTAGSPPPDAPAK